MKDRIVKFIDSEKLSAAEFADKIGVQRSNVSHVLNGRNNPGFGFIQKVLESFPSINSRWLITGEGDMYLNKKAVSESSQPSLFSTTIEVEPEVSPIDLKEPLINHKSMINTKNISTIPEVLPSDNSKKIVKVLIFYSDHTFEDFRPAE